MEPKAKLCYDNVSPCFNCDESEFYLELNILLLPNQME